MSKFIKLALVTAFIAGGAITQVQAESAPVDGLRGGSAVNSAPAASTLSANYDGGFTANIGPDWAGR